MARKVIDSLWGVNLLMFEVLSLEIYIGLLYSSVIEAKTSQKASCADLLGPKLVSKSIELCSQAVLH
jgi:hypothetical protein